MSSSNREGGACDAVVMREDQAMGPIRLPMNRVDDFVDQFNRVYANVGMTLIPVDVSDEESEEEKTFEV